MISSANQESFEPTFHCISRNGDAAQTDSVQTNSTQPNGTVGVAYWIHHAGGGLSGLYRAAQSLGADFPIEVRSPAMPAREELVDVVFEIDLDQMGRKMAQVIHDQRRRDGDQRPFVVIGHSYGSVLAYRIVAHLIDLGDCPHRLVTLSFPAADRLTHQQKLHKLDDTELIEMVDSLFGGVPEAILNDSEAIKFFTPALRFDLGMLERYQHDVASQQIPVSITAICGIDDKAVDLVQMQRWQQMTSADFRLRSMPGDHFFPLSNFGQILRVAAWEWFDLTRQA